MPRIRIDPGFERALNGFPKELKQRAIAALAKFMEHPNLPGLRFERLRGQLRDYYSIRINRGYRILLRREDDAQGELYAAVDAGTHDIYG
jgi:plasmid maintenance system killer protein